MTDPITFRSRGASDGSTSPVVHVLPPSVPRERVMLTITPEHGDARTLRLDLTDGPEGLANPAHDLVRTLLRERAEGTIAALVFEPVADVAARDYEARRAARLARRAARAGASS